MFYNNFKAKPRDHATSNSLIFLQISNSIWVRTDSLTIKMSIGNCLIKFIERRFVEADKFYRPISHRPFYSRQIWRFPYSKYSRSRTSPGEVINRTQRTRNQERKKILEVYMKHILFLIQKTIANVNCLLVSLYLRTSLAVQKNNEVDLN